VHANSRIISPFVAVIFFFMILMIMQVYALMHIAKGQFARWKRYQKVCSSDNEAKEKDMEGICEWLEQVPSIYLSFPRLSLCFLSYFSQIVERTTRTRRRASRPALLRCCAPSRMLSPGARARTKTSWSS
jgi:hypothetical protein